jgi:hypothetical protein
MQEYYLATIGLLQCKHGNMDTITKETDNVGAASKRSASDAQDMA